jgi:hypothetical protein
MEKILIVKSAAKVDQYSYNGFFGKKSLHLQLYALYLQSYDNRMTII